MSIGTQPTEGLLRLDDEGPRYGTLVYDRPLSIDEVRRFELGPVLPDEWVGKTFNERFGHEVLTCKITSVNSRLPGAMTYLVEDFKEQETIGFYRFVERLQAGMYFDLTVCLADVVAPK